MDQKPDLWFKRKTYGWGWTPANAKGWAVTVGCIVLTMLPLWVITDWVVAHVGLYMVCTFFVASLSILICYWKGEKPEWTWGNKNRS